MIGHLNTLMIMMKSIPTAYVRDLQEDKEPLFNALEQTGQSLLIFAGVIQSLKVNKERMQSALDPALYATDVADYLVKKGLPFRQAHALVAQIVTFAESRNTLLSDLTFEEFRNFSDLFDHDILYLFDARTSISKRNLPGGTGPKSVEDQLLKAKQILNTITE
jgi:argininosuccinate lyase